MIAPLLSLFASLLALAPLDVPIVPTAAPAPPDLAGTLQQLASQFSAGATQVLVAIDGTVIDITRVAYITVLIIGVFLYFTRLNRHLGRELIAGGIILAILSQYVFPVLLAT
ncbi:MAG: hypothetical protein OK474_05515 [Thaumarchaeota archaeon]|nr:hypothetical protein [Nitrososphaerota archaeon]